MKNNNPANFKLRLLASLLDFFIFALILILCVYFAIQKPNLSEAITFFLLLSILVLLNPLVLYSHIIFTHYFGATPGKLLIGLKVTNENGGRLSLKRIFFRQTVGYNFSMLVFGLGYLSVIKDPAKQAWHDKAVGSKVMVTQNLWLLGIIVLIVAIYSGSYFINQSYQTLKTDNPLSAEAKQLWKNYQTSVKEESKEIEIDATLSPTVTLLDTAL